MSEKPTTQPNSTRFFLSDDVESYVYYESNSHLTLADCGRRITWYLSATEGITKKSDRKAHARRNLKKFRRFYQLMTNLMDYWQSVVDEK